MCASLVADHPKAWRQDRLDLAKLMLTKVSPMPGELEPSAAEELADTMFEIGRSQSQKLQWQEASYWLEKAHDTILSRSLEAMSSDAEELQIGIMHGMARALINLDDERSRGKAWDLIRKLDVDCRDRLVVLLLKLDMFAVDPAHVAQEYFEAIQTIIRTVHITDTNIKTILHHIHKLRVRSPQMAHTNLLTLLTERLLSADQPKWLEKVFVTAIWNCTTAPDFPNLLTALGSLLDALVPNHGQALSPSSTHAAQSVGSFPYPYCLI